MMRPLILAIASVVLAGRIATSTAQPAPAEPPWSQHVSPEQRTEAQRLLEQGNELFLRAQYRDALARYQAAVEVWDHPAIRFNMVRALIQLDRLVEAYDNLERALAYGSAPLQEQVFAEANSYQRLLRAQIAELEVSCQQANVRVALDGRDFMVCPGTARARLMPGAHQIVASRAGHLTLTRDLVVMPGAHTTTTVELRTIAEATTTRRRWATWKPWLVVGGGAAVAGIGGLLQWKSRADFDQYREELAQQCGVTSCDENDLPRSTRDLASSARLENGLGIAAMVTGGAVAIAGVTLVLFNRPRTVLPDEAIAPRAARIVPTTAPGFFGAAIVGEF